MNMSKFPLKRFGVAVLLAVLAGCTSTGGVSGSATTAQDGTAPGLEGSTVYDTRGVADTYGYNPDGSPRGQSLGGTGAGGAQAQRTVYFEFDSASVPADSRPVVESQARYLNDHPGTVTLLEGHADERGTREYNIGLGDQRAYAVRQLLIAYGVSPQQIQTVSYGEERPAAMGHDERSYALNRRVEFTY